MTKLTLHQQIERVDEWGTWLGQCPAWLDLGDHQFDQHQDAVSDVIFQLAEAGYQPAVDLLKRQQEDAETDDDMSFLQEDDSVEAALQWCRDNGHA